MLCQLPFYSLLPKKAKWRIFVPIDFNLLSPVVLLQGYLIAVILACPESFLGRIPDKQ